ncbi:enoyl-CoA hydratase/isomerase family protein [Ectothiorhodospiraceae bacterium WFHF3C12]|nr:enoyl-CoA hydratase/isomerase family protein [Ectothiorhodospiraceae bacterium WFHF3C12]
MAQPVQLDIQSGVAVITLNSPPVNALGLELRRGLQQAIGQARDDSAVEAVVVASALKLFCAGADISEFSDGTFFSAPSLPALLDELEALDKPVVAAVNGAALGGGLELALACHYRVVDAGTRLGLPEVTLGILPGAGGTQRLPRLAGPARALDMIVSGTPIASAEALELGVVDEVHQGDESLVDAAVRFARAKAGGPVRRTSALPVDKSGLDEGFFDAYRERIAARTRGYYAPERCIQAVEAACELPYPEGLEREAALFSECMDTPQARAQQHIFFAERGSSVIPDLPKGTATRPVRSVGVVGAGTMGGGIAMCFANAGIPVTIVEVKDEALQRGLATIRKNYESTARKGRITDAQVEERMSLIRPSLSFEDLGEADLVIEAVFESMSVKQQVFEQLDAVCKSGAILASNTSTLDVDRIAGFTKRPEEVVGLHFFSPANVMKLLEIVRGAKTAPDVLATAVSLAKTIGKVPVVAGVCFGFIGNRMLEPYAREAHRLLLEGATPSQVDGVLTDFGMAMGVLSMYDLAGIDVGFHVRESRRDELAHDPSYELVADRLYEMGRYGQKTGRGFYVYEGREQKPDPEVEQLCEDIAAELGIARREISDEEIFERCMYMLVNEGADILEEGIAYRPGDIDVVWCNGYGFPRFRGGPMQYADEIGPKTVLDGINKYRESLGEYGRMWFKPSPLLERLVKEDKRFGDLG